MSVKALRNQLLGAIAMVLVAALSLGSSTFAWFTLNTTVTAKNMQVKAKAEAGLLISETAGHTASDLWDNEATANNLPSGVVLIPTSSSDTKAWYHANSKSANDEAGADATQKSTLLSGNYTTLTGVPYTLSTVNTAVSGTNAANAIFFANNNGSEGFQADSADNAYYVKYTYYLKASNESGISGMGLTLNNQNISIQNVQAAVEGGASAQSAVLNKSLRVGVSIGGKFYIFAPMYTGTGSDVPATYYVFDGSDGDSNIEVAPFAANGIAYTDLSSLGGITTDSPAQVDIYVWYEGEDVNCKSENITANLDTLVITLDFVLANMASTQTAYTNNGYPTT